MIFFGNLSLHKTYNPSYNFDPQIDIAHRFMMTIKIVQVWAEI